MDLNRATGGSLGIRATRGTKSRRDKKEENRKQQNIITARKLEHTSERLCDECETVQGR